MSKDKIKILLAEDMPVLRAVWKLMFRSSSSYLIVSEAKNGLEAVDFCNNNEIDVVLMDITMPLMNGIDATKLICEIENAPKVIGMSMHADADYINEIFQAGAKGYLTKDISMEELFFALEAVMNGGYYVGNSLGFIKNIRTEGKYAN